MSTAIITSENSINHLTGDGHPEQPKRVVSITEKLKKKNNLIWKNPNKFDESILKKTHANKYIDTVKNSFPNQGLQFLDGDTVISPGSKEATHDAVASMITAIDGVETKEFKNAFCVVRPPGHHAEKEKAMGFCIYNNVAVGAKYLTEKYKYKKIAIFDFDVHHFNGTQDIFYNNEKVLGISTHQYPFYPGTGSDNEKGKFDNIYNIPLPAGTNSYEYLNALEFGLNKLRQFKPEFILISAGFDSHKDDPLAQFELDSNDFYKITKRILKISKECSNGKVVSILEGGYDLNALAESADEHVNALMEFN